MVQSHGQRAVIAQRQMVPVDRQHSQAPAQGPALSHKHSSGASFPSFLLSLSLSLTLPASLSAALFFCFAHTSFYSTRRSHPICFTIYLSHLAAAPSDLPTELMSIWAGKSAETARDYCMCVQATSSSYPCSYNLDRSVFQSLQCPLHFNSVDFAPVHSGSLQKHRIPH